jgi:hypothetical protein
MSSPQGLDGLVSALGGGQHQRYVDDTTALAHPDTITDGNGILGHIFGSKDVSREVASRAAAPAAVGTSGDALLGMLTPMLDSNRDGSMVDDVIGIIGRLGGR